MCIRISKYYFNNAHIDLVHTQQWHATDLVFIRFIVDRIDAMCVRAFVCWISYYFLHNNIHIIIIAFLLYLVHLLFSMCLLKIIETLCKNPAEFCMKSTFITIQMPCDMHLPLMTYIYFMNIWMSFCCVTKNHFSCLSFQFFFSFFFRCCSRRIDLSKCHDLSMRRRVGFTYHYYFNKRKFLFVVKMSWSEKNRQFKFCLQLSNTIAIRWGFVVFCCGASSFCSWTDHLSAIRQLRPTNSHCAVFRAMEDFAMKIYGINLCI